MPFYNYQTLYKVKTENFEGVIKKQKPFVETNGFSLGHCLSIVMARKATNWIILVGKKVPRQD